MEWFPRENYLKKIRDFYHAADIIKVITGVRRCGKSCLMETIADELKQGGVSEENIFFYDLDSKDYNKIVKADQLEELLENTPKAEGQKYLFIDEVQNVEGFETVLNGFRGTGEWSIFITGSNSYLLFKFPTQQRCRRKRRIGSISLWSRSETTIPSMLPQWIRFFSGAMA